MSNSMNVRYRDAVSNALGYRDYARALVIAHARARSYLRNAATAAIIEHVSTPPLRLLQAEISV